MSNMQNDSTALSPQVLEGYKSISPKPLTPQSNTKAGGLEAVKIVETVTHASASTANKPTSPVIFDFTNYREYLQSFFNYKKSTHSSYTASSFARRAGLGENSRGYLKLVIDGKRNLTSATIRAFSDALSLGADESLYFENLVHFNQSEKPKDKKYYFERLMATSAKNKSKQLELLESQYRIFNYWYVMAIRELVAVEGFIEDVKWICQALKNKVSAPEVRQTIEDLLRTGLLKRNTQTHKLEQSEPLVKIAGGVFNPFIQNFHLGMIERAKEAVTEDAYEDRNVSGVTLSCEKSKLPELKKEIDEFRNIITEKYGLTTAAIDAVIQINFQIFQLSNPKMEFKKDSKPKEKNP